MKNRMGTEILVARLVTNRLCFTLAKPLAALFRVLNPSDIILDPGLTCFLLDTKEKPAKRTSRKNKFIQNC